MEKDRGRGLGRRGTGGGRNGGRIIPSLMSLGGHPRNGSIGRQINNEGSTYAGSRRGHSNSQGTSRGTSNSNGRGHNTGNNTTVRGRSTEQQKKIPVFGFRRLNGFLSEESDNVVMAIGKNLKDWEELIETKLSNADFLVLVIHILGEKVCDTNSIQYQSQINIITKTLGQTFSSRWSEKCGQLSISTNEESQRTPRNENDIVVDHSIARILKNLYNIFSFVASKMSSTAVDYVPKFLPGIGYLLAEISDSDKEVGELQLDKKFRSLKSSIALLAKKKDEQETKVKAFATGRRFGFTEREEEELQALEPPNSFRQIVIVPTMEELKSIEQTFLRPNKKKGAYNDADHYLDVQFRLLREDFVQPLKKGIQDFIKHKFDYLSKKKKMPMGNIRIYPDVQICNLRLVRETITYSIQLPKNKFNWVKWDKSKRLLQGSLLVFTPDNFSTAYFAIVVRRDLNDLKNGIFDVTWEGAVPELDTNERFLMLECEVYFEAYRYTLQILQKIPLIDFPMAKFIVDGCSDVGPPKYLEVCEDQLSIDGTYFSPLQGPWPSADKLKLDDTQYEAFRAALTQEFAIIQGPPGSGKTFLGLKIAEVFLNNLQFWWKDGFSGSGPIFVVCYTNHALDQFLEGILKVLKATFPEEDPSMIRVGSRSKSEELDQYNLTRKRFASRQITRFDSNYWQAKSEAWADVQYYENLRAQAISEISALSRPQGIIDFRSLKAFGPMSLKEEFPEDVWKTIENPRLLGIIDSFFEIQKQNFDARNQFYRWFKSVPFNTNLLYSAMSNPKQANQRSGLEHEELEEEEKDEDYDLDELQMRRLVEEEIDGNSQKKSNQPVFRVKYIEDMSPKHYDKYIQHVFERIGQLEKNERPTQETLNELDYLYKHEAVVNNQKLFLEFLFNMYNGGHIELPNVEHLFKSGPAGKDLFNKLKHAEKWALYFAACDRAKTLTTKYVTQVQRDLISAQKKLAELQNCCDGILLRHSKVVGMTTTGAAKYNDLLKMMKSKIVIVEEAAEVLESHIVTCITSSCEHLILIGDHQQLRPSTTVYDLSTKYNLDVSLFERMLNNSLHCHKLKVQHRMRPEICNLIVGTIYDELENHITVHDYPEVSGVSKNLFFISHNHHEKSESDSMSKENPHEAKFLASLCRYLIQQGYSPQQITVLTTYTGQMFLLKQEIRNFVTCTGVRVTVVDNFQGEENDIILLSLVRSNEENKIGFLKTDNRVCVAISRAKHGLFITGNMEILASQSKTWMKIRDKLNVRNEIGERLELVCQIHGTITQVSTSNDFKDVPEGGCSILCQTKLHCGHECRLVCHIEDRLHEKYNCLFPCEKSCINSHQCQVECFQTCPPCPVKMQKSLRCGHTKMLSCHVDPESIQCEELVLKDLPCGHSKNIACFVDPAGFKCDVKVVRQLSCGHEKQNVDCCIDPSTITCNQMVDKKLPCEHLQLARCSVLPEMVTCETKVMKKLETCGHEFEVECKDFGKEIDCKGPCDYRLKCGHACTRICHFNTDPEHLEYNCRKLCAKDCPNDLHKCESQHKCSVPCPPCTILVEKSLACGIHQMELECQIDPANVQCEFKCDKMVQPCWHKCDKLCFQPCIPCMTLVEKVAPCGHPVMTPCSEDASQNNCEQHVKPLAKSTCGHDTLVPCRLRDTIKSDDIVNYCNHPCGYKFDEKVGGCGHECAGTCSDCRQGRLHKKCQAKCKRMMVCGHVCTSSCCPGACPPCKQKCLLKCDHSVCQRPCGEPCLGCSEKCSWKCEHQQCNKLCREKCDREPCNNPCPKELKCGHNCIGFCGETCPPQCRVCDKKELTEDFFLLGVEDEEDSRFVYLPDCKHSIEREGLENHLIKSGESGEILAKTCPRCTTPIRQSRRYGNIVRESIKDIMTVKRKAYNGKNIKEMKRKFIDEVHGRRASEWSTILPIVQQFIVDKLLVRVTRNMSRDRKRIEWVERSVDVGTLNSLGVIIKHGKEVIKLVSNKKIGQTQPLKSELRNALMLEYYKLFHMLMGREMPFTVTECRDFDQEFQRLFDLHQIYLRKSSASFADGHGKATPLYESALSIINAPKVYSQPMKEEVHNLLKGIDEAIKSGLGISERERVEILRAIGMAQGHWFKCPNGHIYAIGDCGGANQISKCNECGAPIGGMSHDLLPGNDLAGEMDNAVRPAWPTMLHR